MSETWPIVPLVQILTKSDEWIDLKSNETYRQVTVRLWGKGVVLRGEITGAEIASSRQCVVHARQFIASRIDARNGAFGLIPDSLEGGIVTSDFPVFSLNETRMLPEYLHWLSKTGSFVELCKAASEGTTNRVRLKEDRFLALEIPLPPVTEQRRIVARIEQLAAQIEEARRLRHQATEEAEALVLSAARHVRKTGKWKARPISECSKMSTGTTPPSHREDYYGGDMQWYTPGDLEFRSQLGRSTRTISDAAVAEGKARMFDPGTVLLVAIGGSLGKVALTHERCSANQQITGIKFSSDYLPEFGFWWMRSLYHELRDVAPQATLPIINQQRIGVFDIAVIPKAEQRRIVGYLDGLAGQVAALARVQSETASELDALLPSILDRGFKGEL